MRAIPARSGSLVSDEGLWIRWETLQAAQARIARGLALHHGVPDLSCPCETLRCEACGEASPCSTEVALAEQGGQTP